MIYVILIAGFILRMVLINQSFWLDEAISALTALKPFPAQFTEIYNDFQPPLYYILLHFWMKIGFSQEWFLRFPSVIFGLLTVGVVYKFTKELLGEKEALIAAFMLSLSQFHVYYSQELRMYSLLCFLTLLSTWLFYRSKWILYTLVNIVGMYTSYMYFLILVPHLIWYIYKYWGKRKLSLEIAISYLAAGISYLPWWPNFIRQLGFGRNLMVEIPSWKNLSSPPFWKIIPLVFEKFTLGRIDFDNRIFYIMVFLGLALLYGYVFSSIRKKTDERFLFLLNWFISPLVVAILGSFFIPISGIWRLIFLMPPFFILVSYSLSQHKRGTYLLIILSLVSVAGNVMYWLTPGYQREKWKDAVGFLEKSDFPAVFTVENGFAPYLWYKSGDKIICGPNTLDKCLYGKGLYYISYLSDLFDRDGLLEKKIRDNGYKNLSVTDFPGVGFIYYYENSH